MAKAQLCVFVYVYIYIYYAFIVMKLNIIYGEEISNNFNIYINER